MSTPRAPLATTPITLAGDYVIDCPDRFLDPDGQTIMELPVVLEDVKRTKHTFNAAELVTHLTHNAELPAPRNARARRPHITHREVMDENDELRNEDVIELNVDEKLESERRKFFKSLLKKDKALLNDGKHDAALARVQELANGIDPDKRKKLQNTAAAQGIVIAGNDFGHVDYVLRDGRFLIGPADEMDQVGIEIPAPDLKQMAIAERNKRRMRAAAVGTSAATLAAVVSMFTQDEADLNSVDFDTVVLPVVVAFLAATGIQGAIEHYTPTLFRHARTVTGAALTAAAAGTAIFGTQYALNQKDGVQPDEAKAIAVGIGAISIPVLSSVSYYANSIHNWWHGKNKPANAAPVNVATVETVQYPRPAQV